MLCLGSSVRSTAASMGPIERVEDRAHGRTTKHFWTWKLHWRLTCSHRLRSLLGQILECDDRILLRLLRYAKTSLNDHRFLKSLLCNACIINKTSEEYQPEEGFTNQFIFSLCKRSAFPEISINRVRIRENLQMKSLIVC